jgi:hypothetical protein
MYKAAADPYCYPGTTVLKNIPRIRDQATLDQFEAAITAQRADEPFPHGRYGVAHYRAVHRHLFQDVYSWAGKFRTVRLSKGDSTFCYPENIAQECAGCSAHSGPAISCAIGRLAHSRRRVRIFWQRSTPFTRFAKAMAGPRRAF